MLPLILRKGPPAQKEVEEGCVMVISSHSAEGLARKMVLPPDVNAVRDRRVLSAGMTRTWERL